MMEIFRRGLVLTAVAFTAAAASGQMRVRWHNEAVDTTKITNVLIDVEALKLGSNEAIVAECGKRFLGTPYVAGTLEGEPEMLTVNTEEMDCTTFMETAVAMAMTIEARRTSWRDFIYYLTQLRYRGGTVDGYGSRLHYISDWIVDNAHRGNLQDVTDRIGKADYVVKTLDFMTSNRDKYPQLKDDKNYEAMKNAEIGYRSHRFPMLKLQNIKAANIKEGDIIAITTSTKGLDVSHVGIAVTVDGEIHLMHASSKEGKVVMDKHSLQEYVRRNRATGIRVVRIKE